MTSSLRFNKLGGAGGLSGQKYEYKMLSLLFMRGVNLTDAFYMGTNVVGAGAFDDVVFKYKPKGEAEFRTCFIQLKHRSNPKNRISFQNLVESKGDFSLCKYFESYHEIEKEVNDKIKCSGVLFDVPFENCDFILYSNVKVDKLMKEKVRDVPVDRDRVLFGSRGNGCMFCLSSNVDADVYSHSNLVAQGDDCIKGFLPRLQLFAEQASEDQLDSLIQEEIKTALQTNEEDSKKITKTFIEKIQQWWEEKGSLEVLTETAQLWKDIVISRLDVMNDSKRKENEVLNISFSDQEIDSFHQSLSGKSVVNVTSADMKLTSLKISQMLEKHHPNRFIVIDQVSLLKWQPEVLRAWQSVWCDVLVIVCSTNAESLSELSKTSPNKKLILLSESALPGYQPLQDIFSWTTLEETSRNTLLEKEVDFQGYEVHFRSVVGEQSTHALTGDMVIQLQTPGVKLCIGRKLSDVIPYYIPRSLERRDYVMSDTLFKNEYIDDYFVISSVSEQDIDQYQSYGQKIYKYDKTDRKLLHHFYWIEEAITLNEFHQICEKIPEKNVHWLSVNKDNNMFWRHSFNSISVIKAIIHKTGKRTCREEDYKEGVVLLTAEPGMGKSSLATHLAQEAKTKDNSQWVIRVNLNDVANEIRNQDNAFFEEDLNVVKFLLSLETVAECKASEDILRSRLKHTGNVTIIIDGFDEICPHNTDKVIAMIKSMKRLKVTSLWVTSRNVMQPQLESQLDTICYSIKPFDREDQTNFLCKYWKATQTINIDDVVLKKLATELIVAASKSLRDKDKEISVIPLQCLMLAEAFAEDLSTGDLHLPPKLDVLSLYDIFVNKKMFILQKEKDNIDVSDPRNSKRMKLEKEQMIKDHSEAAILLLVSNEDIPLLGNIDVNIEASVINCFADSDERTGLVDGILSGKPSFIHRTFAEYFLAMWLSTNVSSISLFIEKQLLEPGFATVRQFFDRMLARGLPLHNAVLSADKEEVKRLLTSGTEVVNGLDLGGRTALHLAASYSDTNRSDEAGIVQLLLSHGADVGVKEKVLQWTPLRFADKTLSWANVEQLLESGAQTEDLVEIRLLLSVLNSGNVESMKKMKSNHSTKQIVAKGGFHIMQYILDECEIDKNIDLFPADEREETCSISTISYPNTCKSTLLHVAAGSGNAEAAKFLIERGADIKQTNYDMLMASHLAAKSGHLDVLKLLAESGADMEAKVWEQLFSLEGRCYREMSHLQFAAKSGHLEVVKWLSQSCADLHGSDDDYISPLHYAAESGHLDVVKWLSESVTTLDPRDASQMTPLHYAVQRGHLHVVKWLIEAGADPRARTAADCTSLHLSQNSAVTKLLIKRGADLNAMNVFGSTALHQSISRGHVDASKWLIEAGADVDIVEEDRQMTPLHMAAWGGHVDILKCLIEAGAKLNATGRAGCTALHLCVATGNTVEAEEIPYRELVFNKKSSLGKNEDELVTLTKRSSVSSKHVQAAKLLIEAGADPHFRNDVGNTPLYLAWLSGLNDLMKWFVINYKLDAIAQVISEGGDKDLKDENGMSNLHYAALAGHTETVKCLLADDADVNATDKFHATPLHFASQDGNESIVRCLCEAGANVNAKDRNQRTPLHLSAKEGSDRVIKRLLEAKSDSNAVDKDKLTPLHFTSKAGFPITVKFLLEERADVNARNKKGKTALHYASYLGHDATIKCLAKAGADMNARDKDGKSPLHSAQNCIKKDTMKLLVELGSDVNAMDKKGSVCLHSAVQGGDVNTVRWLLQPGASTNVRDYKGETALHMCVDRTVVQILKKHKEEVAELLVQHGININAADNIGSTTLIHSLYYKQIGLARWLVESGADWYFPNYNGDTPLSFARRMDISLIYTKCKSHPLHFAALSGDLDDVTMIISQGVKVNVEDKHRKVPLHYGVLSGQLKVVTFLLEAGADVNRMDANKMTALHYASLEGHEGIVRCILSRGANVNARDRNLATPLHYALQQNNKEIVGCLVKAGADLIAKNVCGEVPLNSADLHRQQDITKLLMNRRSIGNTMDRGRTVSLHSVSQLGDLHFVKLLLNSGVDIEARNGQGKTSLHISVMYGQIDVAKFLIEAGADVNAADSKGITPLLCSIIVGDCDLAMYLVDSGADTNYTTNKGETALFLATRFNRKEFTSWFAKRRNVKQ